MRIKYFVIAAVLVTAVFGLVQGANAYTAQELQDMIANLKKQIADLQVLLDKQTAPDSVNYNCKLDKLDGENITRDKYNTKEECLEKLCDVYGPDNINREDEENRIASRCVFKGNIIKRYVKPDNWCHTFNANLSVSDKGTKPKEVKALQIILAHEGFYMSKTVGVAKFDGIFDANVLQAVKSFQRKNNITPNGKVGPATRAKLNSLYGCASSTLPSIKVILPNGGERWERGKTYNITWDVNGVTGDVIVNIKNNGTCVGGCITIVAASAPATAGTVSYTVPADFALGEKYDVRVGVGGSGSDIEDRSNNYFSIIGSSTPAEPISGVCGSSNGQSFVSQPTTNLCSAGVSPTLPLNTSATGWTWSCLGSNGGTDASCSATKTETAQPSITVTSPNGGETFKQGDSVNIAWSSTGMTEANKINIWVTDDTKSESWMIITGLSGTTKNYSWNIPTNFTLGSKYKIEINGETTPLMTDLSNNYFTIAAAEVVTCTPNWQVGQWSTCSNNSQTRTVTDSNNCGTTTGKPSVSQTCASASTAVSPTTYLTLTSPNGGEVWRKGGTYNITWNSSNLPTGTTVALMLVSGYNNAKIKDIVFKAPVERGSASFTVPTPVSDVGIGKYYKIKIVSSWSGSVVYDLSDDYFIIDNSVASSLDYFAAALAEIAEKIKLLFR